MRVRWLAVLVAVLLAACGSGGRQPPVGATAASPSPITLSIVGTNDLHGAILQREDRGGLPLLAGYVANLRGARARDGGAVLLIDAGDMFQGTLESNLNEGAAVIAAYNALGYAAAAVGNHDFDFGPAGEASTPQDADDDPRGALKARAAEAAFPLLAANLIDSSTGLPVTWPNVRPSTIVTVADVRVGIIGVMTERTLATTIAANTVGLRIAPVAPTLEAEARRLRAAGASVIVATAHAGGRCTEFSVPTDVSSCDESREIVQVARALPTGLVDAIVAGHVHEGMAHQINGVSISSAYANGRAFGRIDLLVDRTTKRVRERRSFAPRDICARVDPGTARCDPEGPNLSARIRAEYEGAPVAPDQVIAAILAPAVDAARAQKEEPLGIALATPLRRTGSWDSPLGNLFTDAYLAAVPGAELAINNTVGGLRADLPAGSLTYGAVFEVMPFDNRVVAFHLNGAALRRIVSAWVGDRTPALPGLSGLRVRVSCRAGRLDIALVRPTGAPVRDEERVLVVTTDFVATGGDRIVEAIMPAEGIAIEQDAGLARDVVVNALRTRGGTLREDQLSDPSPRWVLPGPQPVTCQ